MAFLPHQFQHLLGRDAPVHDPRPPRLAVQAADLLQEELQGLLVRGVPGQDLVRHGKTLRGDNQPDHHLHAVRALVPAVPELALVGGVVGRLDLEVGAGEVIENQVELRPEEIAPPFLKVSEDRFAMGQEPIQAPVKVVLGCEREVLAEEVGHGALGEPLTVQAELAAGIDEAVGDEGLEDVAPAGALPAGRQAGFPELVALQIVPEAVGDHAGRERVCRRGDPRGERLAAVALGAAGALRLTPLLTTGFSLPGTDSDRVRQVLEGHPDVQAAIPQGLEGAMVYGGNIIDTKLEALRKAPEVTVKGVSAKGTASSDTFSLKGLSQALDKVAQNCGG